jgi:hypothetical protein
MREPEQERLPLVCWWAALFVGAALRLRQWAVERSIWLDEASLLRNILPRSERALLKPLDFAQNAPILYLEAVKECSRIFGVSEAALRLPALLSGLLALLLFGLLARRTLSLWPAALATFLFAVLLPSVTHGAEVKQYALDQLAALAITLLALQILQKPERSLWPLALLGIVAIFASHPAVFVLGAAVVAIGIHTLRAERSVRGWSLVALVWAIAFVINYFLFLRHGVQDQSLVNYWHSAFLPLPPRSLHDFSWIYNKFVEVFQDPVGFRTMAGLAAALSLIGVLAWIRSDLECALLLIGPIALALAASAIHKYPFEGRLILFIVPACLLFCMRGWNEIAINLKPEARAISMVIAGLLILEPGYVALQTMIHPGELEELRPLLLQVAAQCGKEDVILVGGETEAAFDYYRNFRDRSIWNAVGAKIVVVENCPTNLATADGRVWLVLSHYTPQQVDSWCACLNSQGFLSKRSITQTGAQAILFEHVQ